MLRRCEQALERATGCERVYTAALGSPASPHFHAHMMPVYAGGANTAGGRLEGANTAGGPGGANTAGGRMEGGAHGWGRPTLRVTGSPFDVFLQVRTGMHIWTDMHTDI